MRDVAAASRAIERVLHKYMQLEEMPFMFGDGVRLTQREIHTIDAIGRNPDINVTQLAQAQGVTKGAMSQMVYRLSDKGYVRKVTSPDSDKELRLILTKAGQQAFAAHKEYHAARTGDFMAMLRAMPEDEFSALGRAVASFEGMVDRELPEQR